MTETRDSTVDTLRRHLVWGALALAAFGLVALATQGCRIWRDYGERIPFESDAGEEQGSDCAPAPSDEPVELSDEATRPVQGSICVGQERWFEVDTELGEKLTVGADYPTEQGVLAVELFAEPPDMQAEHPLESPIWNDEGVRVEEFVTRRIPHYVRLSFPEAPERSTDRIEYELAVERESHVDEVRWLGPEGDESGDGSASNPWGQWSTALPKLESGDMLLVKPGMWSVPDESCPTALEPCVDIDEPVTIDCDEGHQNGSSASPIVVAAQHERRAGVASGGESEALKIQNCEHWEIRGFRFRSRDTPSYADEDKKLYGGGDVVEVNQSNDILVRRIVASHPNRFGNTSVFRFRYAEESILEESELYAFQGAGVSFAWSKNSRARGVYIHSRDRDDRGPDQWGDDDRGNQGFQQWSAGGNAITGSVVEDVHQAYKVVAAGSPEDIELDASDDNFFGSVAAIDSRFGMLLKSDADCNSSADCVAEGNRIRNATMVDVAHAYQFRGGEESDIRKASSFGAANGYVVRTPQGSQPGEFPPARDLSVRQSLVVHGEWPEQTTEGFEIEDGIENASMDWINAFDSERPFENISAEHTYERDPELGSCRVYIPDGSPMKQLDQPIGANMLYRHDVRREDVERTRDFIWDRRTGRFPCGAIIPDGINDTEDASCRDVHERLNLGYGEGACSPP